MQMELSELVELLAYVWWLNPESGEATTTHRFPCTILTNATHLMLCYWKVEMELSSLYLLSICVNPANNSKLLLHNKSPQNLMVQQPFHLAHDSLGCQSLTGEFLPVKFHPTEASSGFLT